MSKIDKDLKDHLQKRVPVMVGNIIPEVHLRNMRIVNKVRKLIEDGYVFTATDKKGIKDEVNAMLDQADAAEPPYVAPPPNVDPVV